jgi:DNA-binding Lrp family transcriptional regulator
LISAELGRENDILEQMRLVESVKEVYITYGVYDLIAIVEAETREELKRAITDKIRTIPGLNTTLTMVVEE